MCGRAAALLYVDHLVGLHVLSGVSVDQSTLASRRAATSLSRVFCRSRHWLGNLRLSRGGGWAE